MAAMLSWLRYFGLRLRAFREYCCIARFNEFGRVAARIDDVFNFIPARMTACAYALVGATANAIRCWRTQARAWSSPNAGPVMAAGAGALQLQLGGAACYHNEIERR